MTLRNSDLVTGLTVVNNFTLEQGRVVGNQGPTLLVTLTTGPFEGDIIYVHSADLIEHWTEASW